MKPILKLNNISFSYMSTSEQITIIDSLSLEVFPGEIISIIGPEKCGKSTILSIICGLTNPTYGYINCSKTHIGYMVQNGDLFQWHNIYRNFSKYYNNPPALYKQPEINSSFSEKCSNINSCKCCEKKAALIKVLASEPDLLLLDDIGAESVSAWSRDEILGPILQYRMEEKLPTFFTSNLSIDELEKFLAINSSSVERVKARRIVERIRQLTVNLELISENRRN